MLLDPVPESFTPDIRVASVLVRVGGDILLLQRNGGSSDDAWGPPAGKIDPGETPVEAAVRELHEETGIVTSVEFLSEAHDPMPVRHGARSILFFAFFLDLATKPEVRLEAREHQDFIWVSPSQALEDIRLVDDEDVSLRRAFPER